MSESPIDWDLAARVAARVSQRGRPDLYRDPTLEPDFAELTPEAEELVGRATGLRSQRGPARSRVTDRAGWVHANIASFQRLLRPLTDRLGQTMLQSSSAAPVARKITGLEVGTLLGWMSGRVLGQYDLLIVEEENPEAQDLVYYVGPNICRLERQYGFPPREFRLWLALHEVTHRAQFTGVPWLREHFLSLVHEALGQLDPDPRKIAERVRAAFRLARAEGRKPLDEGGLVGLIASPEQRAVLDQIGGLMSLLEGHGDVTMNRAGAARLPSAPRFARVLSERRRNVSGATRVLQRLIGLEAKLAQYEQGERFIEAIERAGGTEMLDRVWNGPDSLPTMAEIRQPDRWLARMGVSTGRS